MTAACFDSHCHLQDPRFAGRVDAVVARAQAAGVTHLVCCATREEDWDRVLELAREHACVLPMLGLHPWFVPGAPGWLERLGERLQGAGIGECGLDFSPGRPGRAAQEAAFEAQLGLAIERDLPISIHCVRAWGRLTAILRGFGIPAAGGALHAFSGSAETAAELQRLGLHLSFGARPGQALPARLLFESDAPWGAPEPAGIAGMAGAAGPDLAAQVQRNALSLFRRLLP